MKNEIYEKLKIAQADFKKQLDEMLKDFPELTSANSYVLVKLNDVPIPAMPKESSRRQNENNHWLSYYESPFLPEMYSVYRKYKIFFDDEPASSIQKPETSIQL